MRRLDEGISFTLPSWSSVFPGNGALGDHALPCAHGEINVFLNAERRYFFSVKHNETVKQRMETLV
jgi:hypothetical protein